MPITGGSLGPAKCLNEKKKHVLSYMLNSKSMQGQLMVPLSSNILPTLLPSY